MHKKPKKAEGPARKLNKTTGNLEKFPADYVPIPPGENCKFRRYVDENNQNLIYDYLVGYNPLVMLTNQDATNERQHIKYFATRSYTLYSLQVLL